MALPTAGQMIDRAVEEITQALFHLDESAAWLRSDWVPVGSSLTDEQATARRALFDGIAAAKTAINDAKSRAGR